MKRKMCRKGMVFLAFSMAAFLSACGGGETTETEPEKNGVMWMMEQMKEEKAKNASIAAEEEESKSHVGEGKTVKIKDAKDLERFRDRVNEGEAALEGILEGDIDLSSVCSESAGNWVPIQNYNGSFEGGGHMITGLYIVTDGEESVGLFGETDKDAVIQNLGVEDSVIQGAGYVGAVAGECRGTLVNCWSDSQVTAYGESCGGVAGYAKNLTGCWNLGEVNGAESWTGGVVGEMSGTITDCYNEGTVHGQDFYTGGVIGLMGNENQYAAAVAASGCYNTGKVRGEIYAGGVIGYAFNAWIDKCWNTAEVESPLTAGGIVGYANGKDYEVLMTNCFNKGKVSGLWEGVKSYYGNKYVFEEQDIGGLAGRFFKSAMVNCYNTGELFGSESEARFFRVGGLAGQAYDTYDSHFYNSFAACRIDVRSENAYIQGIGAGARWQQCDNLFFLEGTQSEMPEGSSIWKVTPESFTDGTVLDVLQGWPANGSETRQEWLERFDGREYEISGWKAGDESPCFDWE